jgi:hypothetical protein
LDETAEVKEVDVINKSSKLSSREECGSSSSSTYWPEFPILGIIVLFTFEIISVKMMNKMLVE